MVAACNVNCMQERVCPAPALSSLICLYLLLCSNVMHAGILNLKDGQDFILKQIEELGWAHLRKETVMKT
jgi:hypothetical protein